MDLIQAAEDLEAELRGIFLQYDTNHDGVCDMGEGCKGCGEGGWGLQCCHRTPPRGASTDDFPFVGWGNPTSGIAALRGGH